MYPGMLSAQLLGRLLLEVEKSRNTRDSWTTCLLCHVFRRHFENVPWDAVSTTAGKAVARDREEQQHKGLLSYWLQNNSHNCYIYSTIHVRFRRQFRKDLTCEESKTIHKRCTIWSLKDSSRQMYYMRPQRHLTKSLREYMRPQTFFLVWQYLCLSVRTFTMPKAIFLVETHGETIQEYLWQIGIY